MTEKNPDMHKKKYGLPIIAVFLIPLCTGLPARIILFGEFIKSPFRYYHSIRGLDMMTLLAKGEKFIHGKTPFSPFNLIIYIAHHIFPADFLPEGTVIIQMILGLITALLCTWLVLAITGNRYMAVTAGITASLYAPVLIYETQILKTTVYLFCSVLALTLLLYAKKKQFAFSWTALAGFSAMFPLWERFSGILWPAAALLWILLLHISSSLKERHFSADATKTPVNITQLLITSLKKAFKPMLFFTAGIFISISAVTAVNIYNNQSSAGYYKANFRYIFKTGSAAEADINGPAVSGSDTHKIKSHGTDTVKKKIILYFNKIKDIFSPVQIPNNINYYFVREKLPVLKFMPGPNLVIPAALTGFLILLLNFKFLKKESILFFYAAAFISPIFFFLPLARYKTIMLPLIAFASAYSVFYLINAEKQKKLIFTVIIIFLYIFILSSDNTISRYSTDIYAYSYAAVYRPVKLMEKGRFKEAEIILSEYSRRIPDAPLVTIFLASSYMGQGRFKEAEYLLKHIPVPEKPNLKGRYFFNLADSVRLQNKNKEAALYYSLVQKTPYAYAISPNIKRFIKHYLEKKDTEH
jgi:tetratricopeptide (TPR) repeat protein